MSEYDSLVSEREDFVQTLACVDQITWEFESMTSQLIMDEAQIAVLSEELRQLERDAKSYDWMRYASWPVQKDPVPQAAYQEIEQGLAIQNALGKELCDLAAAYAADLIRWEESLARRERQQKLVRQEKTHQPAAESTAAGTASSSAPAAKPDLDGKIRQIQEILSVLQRQYEDTEQSIQNLHKNSHWWDMDSNSLMEQFAEDVDSLQQQIAQLKSALKVYQTAKATEGIAQEDLIAKVQAVYGPDWQEYFHQRVLLGLDEKGPYWQIGEGARELEHLLTAATMTALTIAASEGMAGPGAAEGVIRDQNPWIIGKYKKLAKITAGENGELQAHHILEVRHMVTWGFSDIEIADAQAVLLSREEHQIVTSMLREELPYGQVYAPEDVWEAYKRVYAEAPEWLDNISVYLHK